MKKYICSVCGYLFDEASGMPDDGIAPGTIWQDVPEDWACPVCGAEKSEFEEQTAKKESQTKAAPVKENDAHSANELTFGEISVICSNLAKGCEKQYRTEEAECFSKLAEYYKSLCALPDKAMISDILDLVSQNLDADYAKCGAAAKEFSDRGALRALTWGEKVTKILSSILTRYQQRKGDILKDKNLFVCEICGFVYLGDEPPEICPVCKVPSFKINKIGREAV